MMNRWDKALQQLRKLKFTPATPEMKARAIITKVYAGALYGVEAAEATGHRINQLTAAVIDVFRSRNDHHSVDWFFSSFLNEHADLDPIVQTITMRILQLRRTTCKKPEMLQTFTRILLQYAHQQDGGTPRWFHDCDEHDEGNDAPLCFSCRKTEGGPKPPEKTGTRSLRTSRAYHQINHLAWAQDRQALQDMAGK